MPKKDAVQPNLETFAYRTFSNRFEVFITVPDSIAEDLPYCLPEFASEMVQRALKPRDDGSWEWRSFTKKSAEKHAGVKLQGSESVILVWGYNYNSGMRIEKLAKLLPFKADVVKHSEGEEFEPRRIRSLK